MEVWFSIGIPPTTVDKCFIRDRMEVKSSLEPICREHQFLSFQHHSATSQLTQTQKTAKCPLNRPNRGYDDSKEQQAYQGGEKGGAWRRSRRRERIDRRLSNGLPLITLQQANKKCKDMMSISGLERRREWKTDSTLAVMPRTSTNVLFETI